MEKTTGRPLVQFSSPQLVRERLQREHVQIPVQPFERLKKGDIFFWTQEVLCQLVDGIHPITGRGCDHFFIKICEEQVHGIWISQNGECCLCSRGTYPNVVPTKGRLVVPVRDLPELFPPLVHKFDIYDL